MKPKVGIVGWRGMVGTVLRERMTEEGDYSLFEPYFFSSSQAGHLAPDHGQLEKKLKDAFRLGDLLEMDIILTTQGGDYTERIYTDLRSNGWQGYWIDAASTLRMKSDSILVLDPINHKMIKQGVESGVKNFIGSNCTVAVLLMGVGGLLVHDEVEWITSMTYQAASGSGIQAMKELLDQMTCLVKTKHEVRNSDSEDVLMLEKKITEVMNEDFFPVKNLGYPLVGGLLPWIDRQVERGQSREELKGMRETNKILGLQDSIPIDGTCVRIGSLRCHSMGLTIKLKRELSIPNIEEIIAEQHEWVKVVPNEKEITLKELTPAAVSGKLTIPVGRIRKMNLGSKFLNAFTVGDQLFWGAAEPLRRVLKIILGSL